MMLTQRHLKLQSDSNSPVRSRHLHFRKEYDLDRYEMHSV